MKPEPLVKLTPNPKDKRDWTREEWIARYRYCRVMTKKIAPFVPTALQDAQKQLHNLLLYGYSNGKD